MKKARMVSGRLIAEWFDSIDEKTHYLESSNIIIERYLSDGNCWVYDDPNYIIIKDNEMYDLSRFPGTIYRCNDTYEEHGIPIKDSIEAFVTKRLAEQIKMASFEFPNAIVRGGLSLLKYLIVLYT